MSAAHSASDSNNTASAQQQQQPPLPAAPNFNSFRFNHIGQPPPLLARMSDVPLNSNSAGDNTFPGTAAQMGSQPGHHAASIELDENDNTALKRPTLLQSLAGGASGGPNVDNENRMQVDAHQPATLSSLNSSFPPASSGPSRRLDGITLQPISASSQLPASQLPLPSHNHGAISDPQGRHTELVASSSETPSVSSSAHATSSIDQVDALELLIAGFPQLRNLQTSLATSLAQLSPPPQWTHLISQAESAEVRASQALEGARRAQRLASAAFESARQSMESCESVLSAAEEARASATSVLSILRQHSSGDKPGPTQEQVHNDIGQRLAEVDNWIADQEENARRAMVMEEARKQLEAAYEAYNSLRMQAGGPRLSSVASSSRRASSFPEQQNLAPVPTPHPTQQTSSPSEFGIIPASRQRQQVSSPSGSLMSTPAPTEASGFSHPASPADLTDVVSQQAQRVEAERKVLQQKLAEARKLAATSGPSHPPATPIHPREQALKMSEPAAAKYKTPVFVRASASAGDEPKSTACPPLFTPGSSSEGEESPLDAQIQESSNSTFPHTPARNLVGEELSNYGGSPMDISETPFTPRVQHNVHRPLPLPQADGNTSNPPTSQLSHSTTSKDLSISPSDVHPDAQGADVGNIPIVPHGQAATDTSREMKTYDRKRVLGADDVKLEGIGDQPGVVLGQTKAKATRDEEEVKVKVEPNEQGEVWVHRPEAELPDVEAVSSAQVVPTSSGKKRKASRQDEQPTSTASNVLFPKQSATTQGSKGPPVKVALPSTSNTSQSIRPNVIAPRSPTERRKSSNSSLPAPTQSSQITVAKALTLPSSNRSSTLSSAQYHASTAEKAALASQSLPPKVELQQVTLSPTSASSSFTSTSSVPVKPLPLPIPASKAKPPTGPAALQAIAKPASTSAPLGNSAPSGPTRAPPPPRTVKHLRQEPMVVDHWSPASDPSRNGGRYSPPSRGGDSYWHDRSPSPPPTPLTTKRQRSRKRRDRDEDEPPSLRARMADGRASSRDREMEYDRHEEYTRKGETYRAQGAQGSTALHSNRPRTPPTPSSRSRSRSASPILDYYRDASSYGHGGESGGSQPRLLNRMASGSNVMPASLSSSIPTGPRNQRGKGGKAGKKAGRGGGNNGRTLQSRLTKAAGPTPSRDLGARLS